MEPTKVPGTLREMWETRPARPHDGRMAAGVAAAIARRYDVDPILIRIGFVVSAFYGIGFALYVAGWALLPSEDGERRSRPKPLVLIALVVLGVISLGTAVSEDGNWFVPTVATLGLLFLLHRSRSGRSTTAAPRDVPAAVAEQPPVVDLTKRPDGAAPPQDEPPVSPPAWDPLGAAPFAWDLPEPTPEPQTPAVRPRSRFPVTPVTLALTLLASSLTAGILLATGGFSPARLAVLCAVALGVIGLGMLVGSVLHTGRGLIPVALLVGLLTWGIASAPLEDWPIGAENGAVELVPTTVTDVPALTTLSSGYVEYDLTRLDLAVGPDGEAGPVRTSVDLGAGYAEILVPEDADVTFTGRAGLGYLEFGNAERGGTDVGLSATDLGADGVRSGRPLVIDADVNMGYVEVRRG